MQRCYGFYEAARASIRPSLTSNQPNTSQGKICGMLHPVEEDTEPPKIARKEYKPSQEEVDATKYVIGHTNLGAQVV